MTKPSYLRDFDLLVLGELFIELSCEGTLTDTAPLLRTAGGEALYTAVTAQRAGLKTEILSTIGRDPFEKIIRNTLEAEGINKDNLISTMGFNGIYFSDTSEGSEKREFLYNRSGSAASECTPDMVDEALVENTRIIYGSSTFQALSKSARQTLFKAFFLGHTHDTMVAYDPNLRLHLWSLDEAREAVWSVMPFIDIMFPSAPEEGKALFGYERPVDIIGFLWDRGVDIPVVKNGAGGCVVGYDRKIEEFSLPESVAKYTTHIGSVFNGAFLAGIAQGKCPFEAGRSATSIAYKKGHCGATIDAIPSDEE